MPQEEGSKFFRTDTFLLPEGHSESGVELPRNTLVLIAVHKTRV